MSQISASYAQRILQSLSGAGVHVALYAGGAAAAQELTVPGYERKDVATTIGAEGLLSTTDVVWDSVTTWPVLTHVGVCDTETGELLLLSELSVPLQPATGQPLRIPAGELRVDFP
mgnify:CR=1 FL=1